MVLLFLIMACSEKNADAPDYNKVHQEAWYNTQYLNEAPFHGTEVKTQGTDSCIKCHDIYGQGRENIPGCYKCHFGPDGSKVPGDSDWVHGLERHEEFSDDQSVCNSCHEVGRSFGTGPGICHNCHGSGETHVLGQAWLDSTLPDYHGNQPQQDCDSCHNLSTDCYQCHFGPTGGKSPPGSNWPHGREDNHNDQKSYSAICNQCHSLTQLYRNEPNDPECHVCHND